MAIFIGPRSFANTIADLGHNQRRRWFDRAPSKSSLFCAFGALFSILAVALALPACAQSDGADVSVTAASISARNLVRWTGSAPNLVGKTVEMSFALYQNPAGGLAIWNETQAVKVGSDGHYTVLLGATSVEGLPQSLFQAGEAQWIEARPVGAQQIAAPDGDSVAQGGPPARSLLAAVPYAFKSVDAETLAGRAADEYVTRENLNSAVANQVQAVHANQTQAVQIVRLPLPIGGTSNASGGGTPGFLPVWATSSTLGSSLVAQYGANIGIGTVVPRTLLDVNGASTLRGTVSLLATEATLAAGSNSPVLQLGASTYSSTSNAAVQQNFVWQATSSGNNTASPTANLTLLFGSDSTAPAETGLSIASSGQITFAQGQTFPGTSTSNLTGVTAGPGLTGGGSSGNVTLALSGPISTGIGGTGASSPAAALANLGGIPITGGTFTGPVSAPSLSAGSTILSTSTGSGTQNTAIGPHVLQRATTGDQNVGIGANALVSLTTGITNVAVGLYALNNDSTGSYNTAVGWGTLAQNTIGVNNTAIGEDAMYLNTTGNYNTALGFEALQGNIGGNNNVAVGESAEHESISGTENVGVGIEALYLNQTGSENVAIGNQSLFNSLTNNNVAVGWYTLWSQTTGGDNTVVGYKAGYTETPANANVSGSRNTYIGVYAGPGNTTQETSSIALGFEAHPLASNHAVIGGPLLTNAYFGSESANANIHGLALYLGTNPSLTYSVNLPNNSPIGWRNAANTVDIEGPYVGSDNNIHIPTQTIFDAPATVDYVRMATSGKIALPSGLLGDHGTDEYLQMSDGTGTSTYTAEYDSSGGLTNGHAVASTNTASAIVARDSSGNFSAGTITAKTITANLTGNASGSAGSVANAVTFNNGGSGASSGSTYNGSGAVTVSYNTIGAQAALGYTPANCTAGTTGSDCLTLSSGLVPVGNLPAATSSNLGAVSTGTSSSSGIANSSGAISAVNFVADTSFTTSTSSVAAHTCNATVQVAMTGVTTTMAFIITPASDSSGWTGWGSTGGLILDVWPTSGYLNYKICNQTGAAISSPSAATFNVSAR